MIFCSGTILISMLFIPYSQNNLEKLLSIGMFCFSGINKCAWEAVENCSHCIHEGRVNCNNVCFTDPEP